MVDRIHHLKSKTVSNFGGVCPSDLTTWLFCISAGNSSNKSAIIFVNLNSCSMQRRMMYISMPSMDFNNTSTAASNGSMKKVRQFRSRTKNNPRINWAEKLAKFVISANFQQIKCHWGRSNEKSGSCCWLGDYSEGRCCSKSKMLPNYRLLYIACHIVALKLVNGSKVSPLL